MILQELALTCCPLRHLGDALALHRSLRVHPALKSLQAGLGKGLEHGRSFTLLQAGSQDLPTVQEKSWQPPEKAMARQLGHGSTRCMRKKTATCGFWGDVILEPRHY